MLSVIVSGHHAGTSLTDLRKCPKFWALLSCVLVHWSEARPVPSVLYYIQQLETRGHGVRNSESSENKFFLNLRYESHPSRCLFNLKFDFLVFFGRKTPHNNHQLSPHLSTGSSSSSADPDSKYSHLPKQQSELLPKWYSFFSFSYI